jgi:hypothetical protein
MKTEKKKKEMMKRVKLKERRSRKWTHSMML